MRRAELLAKTVASGCPDHIFCYAGYYPPGQSQVSSQDTFLTSFLAGAREASRLMMGHCQLWLTLVEVLSPAVNSKVCQLLLAFILTQDGSYRNSMVSEYQAHPSTLHLWCWEGQPWFCQ